MIKNLNALRNALTVLTVFLLGSIVAQPVASFTADTTKGCAGQLVVKFNNTSTGATSYVWNFGDNSSPVATVSPTKLFVTAGTRIVTLIASNGITTDTARLTIIVFNVPVPNFTVVKDTVCVNERVNVTGQVVLGDAPLVQCFWDFGTPPVITSCSDTFFSYSQSGCYQISYFVVDGNGCYSNVIKPNAVCVRKKPNACFDLSSYVTCNVSPQSITFTNCSSHETPGTPMGFQWSFGSTAANPPPRNYSCGENTITLRANDASGCFTEVSKVVKIVCVNAGFTMPTNTPCKGSDFQFTNTSTGSPINPPTDTLRYSWSFQCPVGASTVRDPIYKFTQNGSCTTRLIVTLSGCRDTTYGTVAVTDSIPINFTASQAQKCVPPLTVNFTKTTPGGTNCQWDFGDSTGVSPLCNPTYVYNQFGCFDVTLSVSNPSGCVSKVTKKNFICIESFKGTIGADVVSGCVPLTVNFTNATQVAQPIVDCKWNFGNAPGVASNDCDPPPVTYTTAGNYDVWLRVQTADGCFDTVRRTIIVSPKPTADFVASPLNNCVKKPTVFTCLCTGGTTYNWDFGPGNSSQQNPTWFYDEVGPHTVTLTVSRDDCVTTVTKVNYINTLFPKADFVAPRACGSPTTVNFISQSIGADSLWWDFGDGDSGGNVSSISHTYPSAITYDATLYVKNFATGCVDSITKKINFTSSAPGFGALKTSVCSGNTVSFVDSSSFGTTWLWSFGDGTTSTLKNPTHRYDTIARRYTVKLILDKGTPCEDSVVKVNYITVNKPVAQFTADSTRGCLPLTVNFTDLSQGNFEPIVKWEWRIPSSSNVNYIIQNPTHIFTGTGTAYNIRLTVTDSAGCANTITKVNYIRPIRILPNFNISSPRCTGKQINFTNTTSGPNQYNFYWNYGDGAKDSGSVNGSHSYSSNGTYPVQLTAVEKASGCSAIIEKSIVVAGVGVDFIGLRNFPCPPAPVVFQNLTPDSGLQVNYRWYFGDGRIDTARDPAHIYFYPDCYDVTLVGELSNGCKDSIVKKDYVCVLGPRLEEIQFGPPFGCRPFTVNFSGKIYETDKGTLIWSNGSDTAINITYGDTLYYSSSYTYGDSLIESGPIYPSLLLEDDKGCRVTYPLIDSVFVDEYPLPNQRDTSVCIGASVEYQLPDGDFFLWEPKDYLSCDTCAFVVALAPDTITYIVTATTKYGCVAKDTIVLNVEDIPKLDAGPDFNLCRREERVVQVGDVYNALWQPNTNVSSATSLAPTVYANETTTWIIYSENRLGNRPGCYVYDTLTMRVIDTVRTEPLADTSICAGESILLDLTVIDASITDTTFYWTPASYLDNPNQEDPIATPPFTMDFQVIIRSPLCEPDTHTFNVRVDPLPEIELYRDTVIAVGSEVDLAALSNDAIVYEWGSVDPLSCYDCVTPTLSAVYTQWIYVTVTNEFNCKAIDSAYIRVLPCTPDFVFVPTAFTPNGDGLNDLLYARGKALVEIKTFIVSNRWGNVMYSSNNIKEGWDGTFRGQMAPTDAYVWYVKGICTNGQEVEKKGTITLIR